MTEKQRWGLAWGMFFASAAFYAGVRYYTAPLAEPDPQNVARLTLSVLSGQPASTKLLPAGLGDVHVRLRKGGALLAQGSGAGGTWGENLVAALHEAFAGGPLPDTVTVELANDYQPTIFNEDTARSLASRVGLDGLEFQGADGQIQRFWPLEMVAQGQDFQAALRIPQFSEQSSRFATAQFLVQVGSQRGTPLQRGHAVLPERMRAEDLAEFRRLASDWLVAHVGPSGRLPYGYLPTLDRDSDQGLLPVREWLATWALARLARAGYPGAGPAYARNLHYMLETYRRHGRLLHADGSEHLGDYGLAGLALLSGPAPPPGLLEELERATDVAQRPDGSLLPYPRTPQRQGSEQFYPGEVLLLWATLQQRSPEPARLHRLERALAYYRAFYQREGKLAFVPWHTQAWATLYQVTGDPALREFVFSMNDWLVGQQRLEGPADVRGAFGPGLPYSSATGVYLEGLASACRLARDSGDVARLARYRQAVRGGLHNLWEHQLRTADDLYLALSPDHARGALRSQVSRPAVRLDNLGHAVLAMLDLEPELVPDFWR